MLILTVGEERGWEGGSWVCCPQDAAWSRLEIEHTKLKRMTVILPPTVFMGTVTCFPSLQENTHTHRAK
jgi:hypothetical protein